jgi:hypothetical protein
MDTLVLSLLFLVVLSIIVIVTYTIYDYRIYKTKVDRSFDITSNEFNDKMSIVQNNIEKSKKHFDGKLSNILDINGASDSISNLEKLDSSLKNYFKFRDNGEELKNKKLHDHVFSGINSDLELITKVNIANGMVVHTPEFLYDSKNLKVCNKDKNCVHLNVNSNGFNITPDNIKHMSIKAYDKTDLVKFDLEDKKIFLGGSGTQSPLYIEDNNVYMKDVDMTKIVNNVSKIQRYKTYLDNNLP